MCSQARMYEINYIDQQSQDKNRCGQLAVGSRHSPLRLQIPFLSFPKMLIALTACMGRGVCEKVGPVAKWDGHYY